jgi:hypothetical protein
MEEGREFAVEEKVLEMETFREKEREKRDLLSDDVRLLTSF